MRFSILAIPYMRERGSDRKRFVGLPDATWGERIEAVITLRPRAEVSPQELNGQDPEARSSIA